MEYRIHLSCFPFNIRRKRKQPIKFFSSNKGFGWFPCKYQGKCNKLKLKMKKVGLVVRAMCSVHRGSLAAVAAVFCQIIPSFIALLRGAVKAKPSLTMHQIQGNNLKVQSKPVFQSGWRQSSGYKRLQQLWSNKPKQLKHEFYRQDTRPGYF